MRALIKYDHRTRLMSFFIFHAPHRRIHRKVLAQYREVLWRAAQEAGIHSQIKHHITVSILFINPTGPDLDNLLVALWQALDGKCGKGPTILADDQLIQWIDRTGIMINE